MASVLQTIVEKKHYRFIDGEGVTWQEAVRLSAESLVADGSVDEDYYKQIVACIEKYGPYVVFDHNMVSEKLIDLGVDEDGEEKKANLFFTLSAASSEEHMDNIQQLSSIFMNDPLLDALAAARTPEDILEAEKNYPCEED